MIFLDILQDFIVMLYYHPCPYRLFRIISIGAVRIAELKLRHYEILILLFRYLTKHMFTYYKLSTT
jgi:hypothetical protein